LEPNVSRRQVCAVRLPGAVLAAAVAFSRTRAPSPSATANGGGGGGAGGWAGFLQLDDGCEWDPASGDGGGALARVAGEPLDAGRGYWVALPLHALNGVGRNQPLIDWANARPAAAAAADEAVAEPLLAAVLAGAGGVRLRARLQAAAGAFDRSARMMEMSGEKKSPMAYGYASDRS
jgi:hypothetical protein